MPGNGIQKGSSKLLQDMPICTATTHTVHSLLHGGSMQVHIAHTPPSSFPWSVLSPCPCASLRQHQHYGLENHNVTHITGSPVRRGKEMPWTPTPATLGSTLVPQGRINHRSHHLRVILKHLQVLSSSLLFEAFENDH